MPAMSRLEAAFCSSSPWRLFARRTLVPWVLRGARLEGDVLEIGSGSGAMAAEILAAHPGVSLTATDVDPAMVARAARRLGPFGARGRAQVADATALPFADASFGAALSFLMLHHIPRRDDAVRELVRVLRPGGRLVLFDILDTRFQRGLHAITRSAGITVVTPSGLPRLVDGLPLTGVDVAVSGGQAFRLSAVRA